MMDQCYNNDGSEPCPCHDKLPALRDAFKEAAEVLDWCNDVIQEIDEKAQPIDKGRHEIPQGTLQTLRGVQGGARHVVARARKMGVIE